MKNILPRLLEQSKRLNRRDIKIALAGIVAAFALLLVFSAGPNGVAKLEASDNGGGTLLILLHGYMQNEASMDGVEGTIRKIPGLENASVLKPRLPLKAFSMAQPSQITAHLLAGIDIAWSRRIEAGNKYTNIIIAGHSSGALYARKIYAVACGEQEAAPFDQELRGALGYQEAGPLVAARPWAGEVNRIVLLAGMNRGWSISHHMAKSRAAYTTAAAGIGHVLKWIHGRPPFIFTVRRGAPFITELRLQCLAMRKAAEESGSKAGNATTVQLLGTIDDLVSPDDNLDLISGSHFHYREVKYSGHLNVIDMASDPRDPEGEHAAQERRRALVEAVAGDLKAGDILSPVKGQLHVMPEVTDVVFVIHGIRDEGHWTQKIGYRAQVEGQKAERVVEIETSSYGYFPMLSFLRPGARQEKVAWLMDRYTEARAKYPGAKRFHYVGHSNGTYLLGKALEDYSAVRFENVVFAGSVVRRDYQWDKFIKQQRVKKVLNFVATADSVVAIFPKALQSMGLQDLGSAGHDGFIASRANTNVVQLKTNDKDAYIIGGHSAALAEPIWDSIAKFVIVGEAPALSAVQISPSQGAIVYCLGKIAPLIWVSIAVGLTWLLFLLARLKLREWKKTLLIAAYCFAIWTVLTKI